MALGEGCAEAISVLQLHTPTPHAK
jgi:hypothetical protein